MNKMIVANELVRIAKDLMAGSDKAVEITNALMRKNTMTTHDVMQELDCDQKVAERIRGLTKDAFGPGGKGFNWMVKQVQKILGKTASAKVASHPSLSDVKQVVADTIREHNKMDKTAPDYREQAKNLQTSSLDKMKEIIKQVLESAKNEIVSVLRNNGISVKSAKVKALGVSNTLEIDVDGKGGNINVLVKLDNRGGVYASYEFYTSDDGLENDLPLTGDTVAHLVAGVKDFVKRGFFQDELRDDSALNAPKW